MYVCVGFPGSSASKESFYNAGDTSLTPKSERVGGVGEGVGYPLQYLWASLVAQMVKNPPALWETWVQFLGLGKSPGGGHGNPLHYSCLQNPHGQRSLMGYSLWGHKESDMTEQLSIAQCVCVCVCISAQLCLTLQRYGM